MKPDTEFENNDNLTDTLHLEISDLLAYNSGLNTIKVDKTICDSFEQSNIGIVLIDEDGNKMRLRKYRMLKEDNSGIWMQLQEE